jgi:hypothetical protein
MSLDCEVIKALALCKKEREEEQIRERESFLIEQKKALALLDELESNDEIEPLSPIIKDIIEVDEITFNEDTTQYNITTIDKEYTILKKIEEYELMYLEQYYKELDEQKNKMIKKIEKLENGILKSISNLTELRQK